MLVRREFTVEDPFNVYLLMDDITAREFLYSEEVERHQGLRRAQEQSMVAESQLPTCSSWTVPILEGFDRYDGLWDSEKIASW